MAWDLQKARRAGGDYWSAVYRVGTKRVSSFALGVLTREDVALARSRRKVLPPPHDLVIFEGAPFEGGSRIRQVMVDGRFVGEEVSR